MPSRQRNLPLCISIYFFAPPQLHHRRCALARSSVYVWCSPRSSSTFLGTYPAFPFLFLFLFYVPPLHPYCLSSALIHRCTGYSVIEGSRGADPLEPSTSDFQTAALPSWARVWRSCKIDVKPAQWMATDLRLHCLAVST